MIVTRLIITSRSAPATSTPRLKALFTAPRNPNKNKATAKDPIVKRKRSFLRNRFANIKPRNFMPHLLLKLPAAGLLLQAIPFPGAAWHRRGEPQPGRASPSAPFFYIPSPVVEPGP